MKEYKDPEAEVIIFDNRSFAADVACSGQDGGHFGGNPRDIPDELD